MFTVTHLAQNEPSIASTRSLNLFSRPAMVVSSSVVTDLDCDAAGDEVVGGVAGDVSGGKVARGVAGKEVVAGDVGSVVGGRAVLVLVLC